MAKTLSELQSSVLRPDSMSSVDVVQCLVAGSGRSGRCRRAERGRHWIGIGIGNSNFFAKLPTTTTSSPLNHHHNPHRYDTNTHFSLDFNLDLVHAIHGLGILRLSLLIIPAVPFGACA